MLWHTINNNDQKKEDVLTAALNYYGNWHFKMNSGWDNNKRAVMGGTGHIVRPDDNSQR